DAPADDTADGAAAGHCGGWAGDGAGDALGPKSDPGVLGLLYAAVRVVHAAARRGPVRASGVVSAHRASVAPSAGRHRVRLASDLRARSVTVARARRRGHERAVRP